MNDTDINIINTSSNIDSNANNNNDISSRDSGINMDINKHDNNDDNDNVKENENKIIGCDEEIRSNNGRNYGNNGKNGNNGNNTAYDNTNTNINTNNDIINNIENDDYNYDFDDERNKQQTKNDDNYENNESIKAIRFSLGNIIPIIKEINKHSYPSIRITLFAIGFFVFGLKWTLVGTSIHKLFSYGLNKSFVQLIFMLSWCIFGFFETIFILIFGIIMCLAMFAIYTIVARRYEYLEKGEKLVKEEKIFLSLIEKCCEIELQQDTNENNNKEYNVSWITNRLKTSDYILNKIIINTVFLVKTMLSYIPIIGDEIDTIVERILNIVRGYNLNLNKYNQLVCLHRIDKKIYDSLETLYNHFKKSSSINFKSDEFDINAYIATLRDIGMYCEDDNIINENLLRKFIAAYSTI